MNERIRQLSEQAEEWVCKNYPDAMDDSDEFHSQTMAKFAELIVTKCAVIATRCESNGTKNIGAEILEHFGVEDE